jgi:hypothetical protein
MMRHKSAQPGALERSLRHLSRTARDADVRRMAFGGICPSRAGETWTRRAESSTRHPKAVVLRGLRSVRRTRCRTGRRGQRHGRSGTSPAAVRRSGSRRLRQAPRPARRMRRSRAHPPASSIPAQERRGSRCPAQAVRLNRRPLPKAGRRSIRSAQCPCLPPCTADGHRAPLAQTRWAECLRR